MNAVFATVVSPDGLAVTKASELEGSLRAEVDGQTNVGVRTLATDSSRDLTLVQLGAEGDFSRLPVVRWADAVVEVGRWVVTASPSRTPAAIGVVSVAARTIAPTDSRGVLGVVVDDEQTGRAVIDSVLADSAADRAGLRAGDWVQSVDGVVLQNYRDLSREIFGHHPGEVVELRVRREGESWTTRATLRHVPPKSNDDSDIWNRTDIRSRWDEMNSLGSRLSERRSNFPRAVQHDTVLRPEDCGGPVVNLDGEAVGVNIARAGRTESYFLPASEVRATVDRLRRSAGR